MEKNNKTLPKPANKFSRTAGVVLGVFIFILLDTTGASAMLGVPSLTEKVKEIWEDIKTPDSTENKLITDNSKTDVQDNSSDEFISNTLESDADAFTSTPTPTSSVPPESDFVTISQAISLINNKIGNIVGSLRVSGSVIFPGLIAGDASITPDSLNFADFADDLTLDASTSIATGGTTTLSVTGSLASAARTADIFSISLANDAIHQIFSTF